MSTEHQRLSIRVVQAAKQGLCRALDEASLPGGECEADLVLKWMTEVSSAIYATPLITDLYSDGTKDIVVPSFVHYLEVRASCCSALRCR